MGKQTQKFIKRFAFFSYDFSAFEYSENFLVFAVLTILLVRTLLYSLDYPQIGNSQLHIAHVLLGGILMLIAFNFFMFFLNKEAKYFGSILGGIGFGLFIDEIGKFITSDNNYFFQPAVALIYITFIILFLIFRLLTHKLKPLKTDYLLNALELTKEMAFYNLDDQEKKLALSYLKKANQNNILVQKLTTTIQSIEPIHERENKFITNIKNYFKNLYLNLFRHKKAAQLMIALFALNSIRDIINSIYQLQSLDTTFWNYGGILANISTGILTLWGIIYLQKKNRIKAFEKFKYGILISIFLGHFFAFYHEQFLAGLSLIFEIGIYVSLQFLLDQEIKFKGNYN